MTRVLLAYLTQAIGVRLNIQAWKQIAISIAIKKFSGERLQLDLDIPADSCAGPKGEGISNSKGEANRSMPEAFH